MNKSLCAISLVLIVFSFGCHSKKNDLNLSKEHINFTFKRFDKSLFAYSNKQLTDNDVNKLKKEYGKFYDLYIQGIIHIGKPDESSTTYYLSKFINDPDIQKVYNQTMKKYDDISDIKTSLKSAFKYYHHYFPKQVIPTVYTFISGFNYAVVTDTTILGIGLDMFLGQKYPVYPLLNFSEYQLRTMKKEYVAASAMKGWLVTQFPRPDSIKKLLGYMIYYGKIYYTLDHLMPDTPDSIKIGYTEKELKWCVANKKPMWQHFINKKLLYTEKPFEIKKIIGNGPFTPGFPKGSPGKIGQWVGWQIVKKYMKLYPKTTISELFKLPSDQTFLIKSKYKPN